MCQVDGTTDVREGVGKATEPSGGHTGRRERRMGTSCKERKLGILASPKGVFFFYFSFFRYVESHFDNFASVASSSSVFQFTMFPRMGDSVALGGEKGSGKKTSTVRDGLRDLIQGVTAGGSGGGGRRHYLVRDFFGIFPGRGRFSEPSVDGPFDRVWLAGGGFRVYGFELMARVSK